MEGQTMLTIAISGISLTGAALLCRKATVSMRSMLELSDDLDPVRPVANRDPFSHATLKAPRSHRMAQGRGTAMPLNPAA